MRVLRLVPRTGGHAVDVYPVIDVVSTVPKFALQPGQVIVQLREVAPGTAGEVQESVMELDVLKSHLGALGVDVQLADCLGLIAATRELAGDRDRIIPRHAVPVPDPARVMLVEPGQE